MIITDHNANHGIQTYQSTSVTLANRLTACMLTVTLEPDDLTG